MKCMRILFIIMFFVIISIPIFTINLKKEQVSEIDNRVLQELPVWGQNGDLTKAWESYLTDRIGLRAEMITAYTKMNDYIFKYMVHPTYTYGKNGYVFLKLKNELTDYPFVNEFANFVLKMQKYCEDRNIVFLYCLNPNKTTVYEEYLPAGVDLNNKRTTMLQCLLDEMGASYISNIEELKKAKEKIQVYNIKYDAGHWNDNGAFIGIGNIMNRLKKDYPQIKLLDVADYDITKVNYDTLPVSYFKIEDSSDVYNPKVITSIMDKLYNNEVCISKNFQFFAHYTNPMNKDLPRILIFRGSYFNNKEKFFIDNFSEVTLIHNYVNIVNLDYYVNIFKPDIVLFESVEYATTNDYFPQKVMNQKVFNDSIDSYNSLENKEFTKFGGVKREKGRNLSKLSIEANDDIYCAYITVDDVYYDLIRNNESERMELTIKNEVLKSASSINVLIISKDKLYKWNYKIIIEDV